MTLVVKLPPYKQRDEATMNLHIITTGGTIDKIYFDDKSDFQVGDPVIGELLERMQVGFNFTVESALRKDSLDMTDEDRALIRQRVEKCAIVHGGAPEPLVGIVFEQPAEEGRHRITRDDASFRIALVEPGNNRRGVGQPTFIGEL